MVKVVEIIIKIENDVEEITIAFDIKSIFANGRRVVREGTRVQGQQTIMDL